MCPYALQAYRTILTHFSQRYPRVPAGLGLTQDSDTEAQPDTSQPQPAAPEPPHTEGTQDHTLKAGADELTDACGCDGAAAPCEDGGEDQAARACDKTGPSTLQPVAGCEDATHSIAFDGMSVPLSALPWLPALINPYLDMMLSAGREDREGR